MDINFNVAFAEDGQKSEINENTWKLGWVEIVGGINGVPTAQQFNQFGYIFDKKANIAYAKATEASKGLDDKADKTSVDAALAEKANSADVEEALKGKSDTDHTHDDRYYTESETDTLLGGKADKSDIPTVLPADGGNADTVDGKHAADFAASSNPTIDGIINLTRSNLTVQPSIFGHLNSMRLRVLDPNANNKTFCDMVITPTGIYREAYLDGSNLGRSNINDGGNAATVGGAAVVTSASLGLHRLASGTDEATTSNCPAGCWYGKHS